MTRLKALLPLILAATLAAGAAAAWKVPTPGDATHPGADAAPASSPTTYPDPQGFQARAAAVIKAVADGGLEKWRTGYFSGGDPGKYLPGHAMAKLLLNPDDPEALKYMNDNRSAKEHYHFAAVNWGRFLPVFGDALTPDTRKLLADSARKYGSYHSGGGTENHKVMWYSTALVLPHYLQGDGMLGHQGKDRVLAKMKRWLRDYVKGLYAAGQGEWDSSTYLMFDVNGMLNVYDFSPDPECRLLAKAALDWYVAAYALKYRDGIYMAPNQRGFASEPAGTITDNTGTIWWGSHDTPSHEAMRDWRYTMHAITSSYRPNKVLTAIARKNLPDLPFESRNTKPNYWFGQGIEPEANHSQETVYVAKHYSMGVEWDRAWGAFKDGRVFDQRARFQIVAESPEGGLMLTGGHPWQGHYKDRKGKYDQRAACGAAMMCLTEIPEDELPHHVFFSVPEGGPMPVEEAGWWCMQAGGAYVAVHGLGEKTVLGQTELSGKQKKQNAKAAEQGKPVPHKPKPILQVLGRRTGFVCQTADASDYATRARFVADVRKKCKVDTSGWPGERRVAYTGLDGRTLQMTYRPGEQTAAVAIDGKPVDLRTWQVYDGPYVKQSGGVMTVNDGRDGYTVDCTGDLPVYKPWTPVK